jgi:hypothetical protein
MNFVHAGFIFKTVVAGAAIVAKGKREKLKGL